MGIEKKYLLSIDEDRANKRINISHRMIVVLSSFLVIGIAVNLYLFTSVYSNKSLETKLGVAEQSLEISEANLYTILSEVETLRKDLLRVQQFDNKLKNLIGYEQVPTVDAVGGIATKEFMAANIPLHRQELATKRIQIFLQDLSEEARLEEITQQEILNLMRETGSVGIYTPSIWPLTGFISSRFGSRQNPFGDIEQFHNGIDVAAPKGTLLKAPANGVVTFSGDNGTYGLSITINHGNGIVTRYAHMSQLSVLKGMRVERGQKIGEVGSTGRSTGPHVHYEVIVNGVHSNPLSYILD